MSVTNRKVVITNFGDASNLAIVEEELPAPGSNEVQVSILYSGFAGADINMRLGVYPFQRSAPLTPGYCFVGRVRANGAGSSKFAADDLVCALTVYDSDAHYIDIPEKYLVPVPPGADPRQAVGLVLDWSTAYGMVHRHAKVQAGQRVFIHGLSGAVGQGLLQLCRLAGAEVYGTASARNHAALVAQGAQPFAYTDKAWVGAMQALGGAHAVFDPLGFESFDESWSILCAAEPSTLVAYGTNLNSLVEGRAPRSPWPPMGKLVLRNMAFWSKKSAAFFMITRDQKTFEPELRTLLGWLAEGKITVPIKKVWDMEDVKLAHESWGKGEGMGSLVLRISGE
ncbi:Protein indc11 [Escovopsis weberi]|uniref:Protein indc11 n=1 Tax=Escovopsis weberi TaxID=150374 RepID=A0A0N0RTV1_ESCWE|nr:Protein indc11 [Escovopsis weberi]